MSGSKRDKPRTGTGDKARGKKPSEVGLLRQQTPEWGGRATPTQPPGWGIAKVISILRRR